MNRIYFFANFGDWKKLPLGGGEIGNRKTLQLMNEMDLEVKLIPKYLHVSGHSFINIVRLVLRIIWNIICYFTILLFGRRNNSIVHIAGFYGSMIYFECLLVRLAKLLKYRVVYEMRGGGADFYYEKGSNLYKKSFSDVINKCDSIFSQGKENNPLILKLSPKKHIFYYPNFVMSSFYSLEKPCKPTDRVNLVYFGRISKAKNIDVILDAFYILSDKYDNIYLEIIGNTEEPVYLEMLKRQINDKKFENKVSFLSACEHDLLKQHLKDKHFYLFPTLEPREGHSNALTEAMAWGIIPVATRQGFNASVIGDDKFLVDTISAVSFAEIVEDVINNNKILHYSSYFYHRVINNYTDKILYERLNKEYQNLFNMYF